MSGTHPADCACRSCDLRPVPGLYDVDLTPGVTAAVVADRLGDLPARAVLVSVDAGGLVFSTRLGDL
ncbi:hypothetical protein AB1484_31945 [Parafrankia sp. FMc6]|uniref:hypothetical protein n=1 Tax=Parafrankia soli TaxID=2599596 RepID=UPI0034D3F90F